MWLLLLHHEEYMDIGTMETQLQDFARHLQRGNCNQRFVPHSVSSIGVVGTTIPAPGMSNTGFGHSVIATTSGDISMMPVHSSKTLISNPSGMGHMLPAGSGFDHMRSNSFMAADGNSNKMVNVLANSGDNFSSVPGPLGNMLQSQQGFGGMSMGAENQIIATRGLQGVRSQMIPTSGLRKSASALIKTSPSGGMGHSSVNYIRTIPPQQISGGASGCFYHNMSGQMGGNNMRWKNSSYGLVNGSMNCGIQMAENNQNLMDGTAALSNSGGYLNTLQYGNVQLHASSDQNTAQQHRQGLLQSAMTNQMIPLSGDGYALNAADLAGSRNLHGPVPSGVLSVASSLNGKPIGLQSTKTLPVLGLLSQQQILPTLQQCRQNQSQKMSSPHGLSFLPKGQSIQSKQQKLRYQQQQSQDQQEAQSNNVYNDVAAQVKPKVCLQREHELQSQERRHLPQQFSCMIQQQKPSQEELTQLMHKDMVREHQPSQQVSRNAIASTAASQPRPGTAGSASGNMQPNVSSKQQKMQYCKQQMWLLLLHHASRCRGPEGQCQTSNCIIGRKLWAHVTTCRDTQCIYPHCHESRKLLIHRQQCQNNSCPVCRPVWEYIMKQHANGYAQSSNLGALDFVNVVPKSSNFHSTGGAKINLPASCGTSIHDTAQEEQHSLKRRKTEPASPSYAHQGDSIHDTAQEEQCSIKRRKIESASPSYAHQRAESAMVSVRSPSEVQELTQMQTQAFQPSGHDAGMMESHVLKSSKVEPIPVNIEQAVSSQKGLNQNIEPASPSYAHQGASIHDTTQEEHYSIKRRKTEPASLSHAHQGAESAMVSVRSSSEVQAVTQMQTQAFQPSGHDAGMMESHVLRSSKVEPIPVNIEQAVSSQQGLSQNTEPASPSYADKGASIHDTAQEEQRSFKRRKTEPASPSHAHQGAESAMVSVSSPSEVQAPTQMQTQAFQPSGHDAGMMESDVLKSSKVDPIPVNIEQAVSSQQGLSQKSWEFKNDICQNPHAEHGHIQGQPAKAEPGVSFSENVPMQVKQEAVQETIIDISPPDNSASEKFVKPAKINGVSLTELFTLEQIREHVIGLQQWGWQSKAKDENYQIMEFQMTGETCQLCNLDTIKFDPSPIYCSPCGVRIKRNAIYYLLAAADTRYCFCIACYSESQGDSVKIDGNAYAKLNLEKKKNMDETEEPWVCCDICKKWQHQVCVLFNDKRNKNEQAEYTCPNCYTEQLKRGVRQPLPHSVVLGAKDIPRTFLSDHIEKRLIRRLKEERQERAKALGKNFEEVPGTEALVVRVVSSVDKILEVKQGFLDIFEHQNYPSEFPYKSKVLLLFQKIEGVEVCLFGMYAQEFGSECSHPNQRRIYLSYLDSVRYFRPDVKTVTGEALRTFVYHEILIGYLDYCKSRGLTSCYIWACPAPKGEDYILYCHPETQKTPKSDKLREWYLTMLRKASKEDIVVDVTNMYDYFFVSTGERKAKVTAARLPYFEGDYWPGAAEEMILQIQREEADGQKYQKNKKYTTKRSLKATAQTEVARNTSKDALLMKKLGDSIHPMKEDFIMVHLQQACTHCCLFIVSGKRWVCKQCKDFQLCEKCYKAEQKLDERERHPVKKREKHMLFSIEVTNVPADTKDKDEIMESEFFDTRQAFLSLCQGNHYQYDTLRRAKHSSMMILYHLHNPTAPAFVSTCNICQQDIETGQGLRCEVCPDYDLCNVCYQRDDSVKHPHRFTAHPSLADRDAQNQEARQHRVLQLRKMRDLLLHASRCLSPQCAYQNCRKVKALFRHAMNCKKRAAQGCSPCKKLWYILQLHAWACNESECCVPRCRDLKQHIRRSQNQMESRRRADVMEMMRNRAAEIAQDSHSSHVH